VTVRERLPDSVLAEADQIVNIDLAAEDLQKRLKDGKIYPAERVQQSLENFFTNSNLEHLRELALRELASQLDFKRRETTPQKADGRRRTARRIRSWSVFPRAAPTARGCCGSPRAWRGD
jgi:K+-sensing histidine kinase KdpD